MFLQRRWLSLGVLACVAGLWCVALGVLGLWLIAAEHRGLLSNPLVSLSAGLVCLCGAQMVFLECVAERLFPHAHRGPRMVIRGLNALTLGGSACVLMLVLLFISV